MECIYLDGKACKAKPIQINNIYKPTDKDMTEYCKNAVDMGKCPRARLYLAHLNTSKE